MALNTQIIRLSIKGFKSLRSWENYEPGPLNVLIGQNGAGKSNFIGFFRLMSWMMQGNLQFHIGEKGGASKLLFDGPAVTREIECEISMRSPGGENDYSFRLFFAAADTLIFADEKYRFTRKGRSAYRWTELGAGHREARLIEYAQHMTDQGNGIPRFLLDLIKGCRVYQFHNTSDTARSKQKWKVEDKWLLKEDAGNIAPVLLRLRDEIPDSYRRIVDHVRQILPFFDEFVLQQDHGNVLLQWRERGSDMLLDASSASDGMLRVFALLVLLCQPASDLPDVLILDEPELGLHPAAIELVAGLLKEASSHTQIITATQSSNLLNEFEPEDVTVVERNGRESVFRKLDKDKLSLWLDEYSLSDLWWKNVLGGKP